MQRFGHNVSMSMGTSHNTRACLHVYQLVLITVSVGAGRLAAVYRVACSNPTRCSYLYGVRVVPGIGSSICLNYLLNRHTMPQNLNK